MDIDPLLAEIASTENISDLHLTVNSHPVIRKDGELMEYETYEHRFGFTELEEIIQGLMTEEQWDEYEKNGELDFSYSLPGVSRFRINAYRQRGAACLALRVIPSEVPTIEELKLPEIIRKLSDQSQGLLLTTGPTGSGKSTTQAAIINEINENRSCHILTLEDPIEYLHKHHISYIHQREVGSDTRSFSRGLRAALRQDPDVILVGEMRDLDTISITLEAAETGHLVLATLHTNSASQTVDRIVDVFPAERQKQVRIQLASVINGVIAQKLLPRKDGRGRVAAFEIMIGTPAVRNIIREGKTSQLYSTIQTGGKYGMIVMDHSLLELYHKGQISREMALSRAENPDSIRDRLRRSRPQKR